MKELETLKLYRGATSVIELDFTGFNFESNSYCQLTIKKKYNGDIVFQHDFNKPIKYYVTFKDEFTVGLDDNDYKYDIMYMLNEERYPQCSISDIVIDGVLNGYEGEFDTNAVHITEVLAEGVEITQSIKVTTSNVIIVSSNLQERIITPTKEEQVVLAEDGFDGMSKVVVEAIPSEYVIPNLQDKTIEVKPTENKFIMPDEGFNGLGVVNVIGVVDTENIEITPTKETQTINRSEDKYIESVTVNPIPEDYIIPSGELEIIENGNYNVREIESVNVDVKANLGTKTITSNGVYNASDDNLDGYSSVEVETSGGDLTKYFNTNPENERPNGALGMTSWANNNYVLKMPDIVIPSKVYTLQRFFMNWKHSIAPKVIFGNTVTSLEEMYNGGTASNSSADNLLEIDTSGWNTENVTSMKYMFYNCKKLEKVELGNLDTRNVIYMGYMFGYCENLTVIDVSNFNTSNVTDMNNMFRGCESVENLDVSKFDTSKVTTMTSMFGTCNKITSLDLSNFNTSQVIDMSYMFQGYSGGHLLSTVNMGSFDMSKVIMITGIFQTTRALTNLIFGHDLGKAYKQKSANYSSYRLDLSACKLLTHDSLMSVINGLYDLNLSYDVANGGTLYTQSLILGADNLNKLSDEEKAIVTNKGWTLS